MTGTAPTLTGTADATEYTTGDPFTITVTEVDPDTRVEIEDTAGTAPDGTQETVHEVRTYIDTATVTAAWHDAATGVPLPGPLTVTATGPARWDVTGVAPGADAVVVVGAIDSQGNAATTSVHLTVTAPPPAALVVGCAISAYPQSGRTRAQEYAQYKTDCGQPGYLRVYLNPAQSTVGAFPTSWPVPGEMSDWMQRGTVLSAKVDPVAFAAGLYDVPVLSMLRSYTGVFLDWGPLHEPEDDVKAGKFTAAQWRAAQARAVFLNKQAANPKTKVAAILQGYTFDHSSGRNPEDYWVPGVDIYGTDDYDVPSVRHDGSPSPTAAQMQGTVVTWCRAKGVDIAWYEDGIAPDFASPTARAVKLADHEQWVIANGYLRWSYFDSQGPKGDWFVRCIVRRANGDYYPGPLGAIVSVTPDPTSTAAWRAVQLRHQAS